VKVGVIGAGLMGSVHARLLGDALVAVADPAAPGARYADGLELIADPAVEAVVVASPASTHERYVLACIDAGKRVLCEKPLADSAAAARRIVEADAGLVTVGFMRRFDPAYVALKARLDAGAIGAPLLVHCAHRNVSVHDFFDSAMILTDSAVHEIDVTRWLLDDEIARVTVHAPRTTARGLRDPQLVLLETAGGRLVDVEAFVNAGYGYDIRCEVVGEDGTLELERHAPAADFRERFATAYEQELRAWLAGEGGATARDGYVAAVVAEAAVQSLETGAPADVRLA
jgi:myo-inositol 2-dehydrogenase/D-chiro-inositol 1-dehydrogenase